MGKQTMNTVHPMQNSQPRSCQRKQVRKCTRHKNEQGHGVQQGSRSSIASVDVVNSFEVKVPMGVEQLAPAGPLVSPNAEGEGKSDHRLVLTDFDLSMRVSVPTSSLPMSVGAMLYFSSKFCAPLLRSVTPQPYRRRTATAVMQTELMSSRSLQKAMFCCLRAYRETVFDQGQYNRPQADGELPFLLTHESAARVNARMPLTRLTSPAQIAGRQFGGSKSPCR